MNPSSALAAVVVDELVRDGVREAVLSPGSRNAPLAYALYEADRAGRLRLHVRIDERSAGFLALGLAKGSGQPVVVTTTSGTAAVNLHPAIVEADYAGVPVIALTADRPVELRGTGANQTINQTELFGGSVRRFAELSVDTAPSEAEQRAMVRDALARSLGGTSSAGERDHACGPVHLNVGLREPLVPDLDGLTSKATDEPLGEGEAITSGAEPATPASTSIPPAEPAVTPAAVGPAASVATAPSESGERPSPGYGTRTPTSDSRRTIVVAGDGAGPLAEQVAHEAGLPLLAEPSSGARFGPNALGAYRLYLDELAEDVERVIVLGRPTLSRPVARLLARPDVGVVRSGSLDRVGRTSGEPEPWARRWFEVDAVARSAVVGVLEACPLSGVAVAAVVAEVLTSETLLLAGSSSAIRDLDLASPFDPPAPLVDDSAETHAGGTPTVLANRGASGIDGTVSTAIGAALAHQRLDGRSVGTDAPAYALMGDLTFLHDSNGLVLGPDEPQPDLTIVVVNDDGGGLFSLLEQGEPERAEPFERVFGTPHRVDISALCAATSTPYVRATSLDELKSALEPQPGIRVVEVPVDRSRTRDLHARLKAAALDAIAHLTP